jgi:hypothetical protein
MKKVLLLGVLFLTSISIGAQQVSLYGSDGEATAYIDYNKEATIFLWDGTPVAFITSDRIDICVFGFNGRFLGWYDNGILYDKNGYAVGARKDATNMVTKLERIKGIQKITPIRPILPMTPIKPMWKNYWSNTSLLEFLYYGK